MAKWEDLIGKKIIAFRGHTSYERTMSGRFVLTYILFDDQKTWVELREQNPYDYHDCCDDARMLDVYSDAEKWKKMFDKDGCEEVIVWE